MLIYIMTISCQGGLVKSELFGTCQAFENVYYVEISSKQQKIDYQEV